MTISKFIKTALIGLATWTCGAASAVTYTLPAAFGTGPFASCALSSGTTYACSSNIVLGPGDVVNATSPQTININGGFSSGSSNVIGSAASAVNIVSSSNISLGANSVLNGNATARGGSVTLNSGAVLNGNLLATSAALGAGSNVTGISCTGTCLTATTITQVSTTGKFNTATANSIQSNPLTNSPVVGNLMIVSAWSFNGASAPTLSASDNFGNVYTSIAQRNVTSGANFQNTAILIAPIKFTGTGFRVTVTSSAPGSQIEAVAVQYAGIASVDQVNATSTFVHPPTISTLASTSSRVQLVIAANSVATPPSTFTSITQLSGYTVLARQLNNAGVTAGQADARLTTTAGVQSDQWTYRSSNGAWATAQVIATFVPGTPTQAPSVTTTGATAISATSATLNSIVNANNASTTITFEYGTATGNYTSTGLVASGSPVAASGTPFHVLNGLVCNTTYFFRVKGVSSIATVFGSELSFKTASCPPGDFDAYEVSFTAPTAAAAKINTRVASAAGLCSASPSSCSLKIASFNAGTRTFNTAFTDPVKIEIVDASAGVCSTHNVVSTWQASQTLSTTGETTLALPAITSAHQNLRVRISHPATGTATTQSCSSNNFSIRPASFSVLFQDSDPSTAGTARTLSTTSATGPAHRSGSPMTVTLNALTAEGTVASNYSGTPSLSLGACSGVACGGTLGSLTNGVGAFTSGIFVSSTASYSDVGAFVAIYRDSTWTAVDAADGVPSTFLSFSGSSNVGRFYPHHFDVTVTQACTTGSAAFTYNAQPFAMRVTARNAAGGTTANYSGSLAKAVTLSPQNALAGSLGLTSLGASSFTAGASTVLASSGQSYTYTNKLTGPSILDIRATDPDGATSDPASGGLEEDVLIRSGRLKVFGALGGDRSTMQVPLALEYWNGSTWVTHADDNCTSLTAANVALTSNSNALATYSAANPVFSGGLGQVAITPSASSGTPSGTVNLAIHLGSSGSDQSCHPLHAGTAAARPWLRSFFGSCASTADRDPGAQLRFGSYTNESRRQVHIREVR